MGRKAVIAALATGAVLIGGLTSPASARDTDEVLVTDQELVLSLVFGVGEVADDLGIAASVDAAGNKRVQEAVTAYEEGASIAASDFLAYSGSDAEAALTLLRSGDPVDVSAGLNQLGAEVDSFIDSRTTETSLSATVSPMCGVAVVCVAYAAAAVHNTVAVTALAVAVVAALAWCGAWTWCKKSGTVASIGAHEQFAVDLATRVES